MNDQINLQRDDPDRDTELNANLRDLYGDPPEIDGDALDQRIIAAAELPLARMRREFETRRRRKWLAPFIPLAVAAGVTAMLVIGSDNAPDTRVAAINDDSSLERLLFEPELTEQEFELLATSGEDPAELLLVALDS